MVAVAVLVKEREAGGGEGRGERGEGGRKRKKKRKKESREKKVCASQAAARWLARSCSVFELSLCFSLARSSASRHASIRHLPRRDASRESNPDFFAPDS